MREILFKAKRKDSNEWVEGYYAKLGYGKNIKHFIIQNVFLQEDISYFEDIEINPNTLSQYTGLNDNTKWDELTELEKELFLSNWNYQEDRKNKVEDWKGKKIWENDIISIHSYSYYEPEDDYFGVVKYCEKDACWVLKNNERFNEIICECFGSYTTQMINHGNIFDNADLMEVE